MAGVNWTDTTGLHRGHGDCGRTEEPRRCDRLGAALAEGDRRYRRCLALVVPGFGFDDSEIVGIGRAGFAAACHSYRSSYSHCGGVSRGCVSADGKGLLFGGYGWGGLRGHRLE